MTYWVAGAAVLGAGASIYEGNKGDAAASSAAGKSASAERYAANLQNQQYKQTRQDQMPWLNTGKAALSKLAFLTGVGPSGQQTWGQLKAKLTPQFSSYAGPQTTPTVDTAGLNAAVEKAYGAQKINPLYGSLLHNFSTADFQQDPGYQYRLQQGMNGINNSFAARGGLLSGAAVKAAMRENQGFASNELQNAYNRYNTNQSNEYNRLASLANVGQTASNTLGQAGSAYANNIGNLAMGNAANQGNALLAGAQLRSSGYQGALNGLGKYDWSKMFGSNGSNEYANQYAANAGGY